MPGIPYKPTKKLEELALEWGKTGGGWCNFSEQIGIHEETARKYYRKFWRKGKNDVITQLGRGYLDMIEDGLDKANDVSEKMQVAKAIDSFLSKRSPEWAAKQQIEQTNVNIDAGTSDYSKFTEEDKKIMDAIILKTKR